MARSMDTQKVCKAATQESNEVVKSGTYKETKWTTYENGLLEVTGTGDMYPAGETPEWISYSSEIKSARIQVTGATNLSSLFSKCYCLETVDLSKLDTANVTDMGEMFFGVIICKNWI